MLYLIVEYIVMPRVIKFMKSLSHVVKFTKLYQLRSNFRSNAVYILVSQSVSKFVDCAMKVNWECIVECDIR